MNTFIKLHSFIEIRGTYYKECFIGIFGKVTTCREVPYSVVVWC